MGTGSMKGKTILVVDDEKLVRWSTRQKLESAGYEVLEASEAADAITLFKQRMPDLVTLDIHLPDGNGLKVLVEMKKISPGTPIIIITADAAVDYASKALELGATDYLEKPINLDRLLYLLRIEFATSKRRARDGVEDKRRTA